MSSNFLIDKNGRQSKGVLLLRTLAMPSNTNANGDIFGGWIMSQMDMGGAILAKEIAHGRVVTVENMNFIKPISVGAVVCCYGQCLKVGRSSIKIKVEVWVKKVASEPIGERYCVTDAVFTFVAVDSNGKSRTIPRENNHELEKALALIAELESEQTNQ